MDERSLLQKNLFVAKFVDKVLFTTSSVCLVYHD